ncbi:dynein axonemal intermediate chain 7 isoform X2 [Astyanax mexicanus]|uniref:dynein axonemal intermediate chain 7 isoform X2 n=1 Tax=Astyanax mexicanus TaxID=7994 RepID=UPI0020CB2EB1|nr:dynein axonemal intermediate chain 7 isoform X2 [Astyanax mexicanus]
MRATRKKRSAKKKDGRTSKAEKERLQKEEEERRRKEEEALLIAEQEEQERLEREQREEEERQRLELKDRDRREEELNELRFKLEENQSAVNTWEAASREQAEWDQYMLCDGNPNPAVQPEINTFISLWQDDPELQIQPIMQQCALALRLTDELGLLLNPELESAVDQVYYSTLLSLQNLIHNKYLLATEEILNRAKACVDNETGNMQTVVQDDNITLCLWANLNKKPRFKGYHFKDVGLGFELPRQLAMSDIAVRFLHTNYDHLSHLSHRAQEEKRKLEKEEEENTETTLTLPETPRALEDGEMKGEENGRTSAEQADEEIQSLKSERKKSAASVHSAKKERKSSSRRQKEEGEGQIEIETIVEGVSTSAGETDEADSAPAVAVPVTDSREEHVVDLQKYTPLGGVFYFEVFHLPPQSYTARGWEIRQLLDTGLQVFPYQSEPSLVQIAVSGKQDDNSTQSGAVGVTVILPDSVIFLKEPQVARWDATGQHWRTDCIMDTSYSAETRSVSFRMESFSSFTLLQEIYANMPFQSWELRPLGQDSVLFTLNTALSELSITVKGNQCMLQMKDALELAHILGKWMSLSSLQTAMRRAGVNIFVNEYSDKYVTVNKKDPLIEHAVYEQMALVSSSYAFSWSQWNTQCGQEHLVLQVCEQLSASPVPEEAWSLYLLGAQRSQRLNISERSEAFSLDLAEGTEFHSTLLHMLRDSMSPEGRARIDHSHFLYTNTVQKLLSATRVLTFTRRDVYTADN